MGERIPAFSTKTSRDGSKYPWEEWSDGCVWRIAQGEDFSSPIASMSKIIHSKARALGGYASVHKVSDTILEFQMDVPQ